jgi:CheY-like chemotaxis protein
MVLVPPTTVLLVEDLDSLRAITRRILERHGFRVITAPNGNVALDALEQHPGEINVLLSDVAMPEVNGIVLAQEVRTRFPGVKIILMSGYAAESLEGMGATRWMDTMVQKPFTAETLVAAVQQAA